MKIALTRRGYMTRLDGVNKLIAISGEGLKSLVMKSRSLAGAIEILREKT
jgi:hypothetical protein